MNKLLLTTAMICLAMPALADGRLKEDISELPAAAVYGAGDMALIYDASADNYTKTSAAGVAHAGRDFFTICGDNTTINNNTVYYGPSTTLTANTANGQACDINAAGNTTEATADEPILTGAFHVLGMTCRNEADANAAISYTLRSAAAATTPSVTCTIADDIRSCVADVQTTTQIAAGATVAIAAASTGNIGDNTGFVCKVDIAY